MKKIMTHFVLAEEGGNWIDFDDWVLTPVPSPKGKLVHAIKFEDGSIWDAYNGWREFRSYPEKYERYKR